MSSDLLDAPVATLAPVAKRIVIQLPGDQHQIVGLWEEAHQPPDFIPEGAGVTHQGVPIAVSLVAVKPRFYLYTIVQKPEGLKRFDEMQR